MTNRCTYEEYDTTTFLRWAYLCVVHKTDNVYFYCFDFYAPEYYERLQYYKLLNHASCLHRALQDDVAGAQRLAALIAWV